MKRWLVLGVFLFGFTIAQEISVSIHSDPPGADVYVNGEHVGVTPATFPATRQVEHSYRVDAGAGYVPFEGTFNFSQNEAISVWLDRTTGAPPVAFDDAAVHSFVARYFDGAINRGESGIEFWCKDNLSQLMFSSLFAPRSWQMLSIRHRDTEISARVRVNSSNRGGLPIVGDWTLVLNKAPNGLCISWLVGS